LGDAVLLDSDSLDHSSFLYEGEEKWNHLDKEQDRLVALFVLHRPFLRLKGFPNPQALAQETFDQATLPKRSEGRQCEPPATRLHLDEAVRLQQETTQATKKRKRTSSQKKKRAKRKKHW
jgi:hypothetical protein